VAGFGNSLNDFHVVDVKRTDGVPARIGFLEHFGRIYQWHLDHTPE
jgi:hypothetical protein